MDPITGISLILALIPFWQRERDKKEAATKEELFEWLINHRFEALKNRIENNAVLLIQIEDLLKMNQDELLDRFDSVDEKLMRILYGMEDFRSFVTKVYPQAVLTKREESILKQFVDSGENILFCVKTNSQVILQAGSNVIADYDPRFVDSNLNNLAEKGYILCYKTKGSDSYYHLTEAGADYIESLKEQDPLSSQAKDILVQYYQTDEPFLLTCLDGQGKVDCVQVNNVPLTFCDPNYVHDDLDVLANAGLIKFDGALDHGGRRYTRTRKGEEYVKILKGKPHADA